jgi:hypothetical protein
MYLPIEIKKLVQFYFPLYGIRLTLQKYPYFGIRTSVFRFFRPRHSSALPYIGITDYRHLRTLAYIDYGTLALRKQRLADLDAHNHLIRNGFPRFVCSINTAARSLSRFGHRNPFALALAPQCRRVASHITILFTLTYWLYFVLVHSTHTLRITSFGAHREGFQLKNVPSTRRTTRSGLDTSHIGLTPDELREELISDFRNLSIDDEELFYSLPFGSQLHDHLSPSNSPLYSLSDLPTPSPSPEFNTDSPATTIYPTQQTIQMAEPVTNSIIPMPARGERGAPSFDAARTHQLPRFFKELEYLFGRANVATDDEKKKQLLRYVDYDIEQIWETFAECEDPTKTYEEFKAAIISYYPEASGEFKYSLRDMDSLVGERQRLGITNLNDLSYYHLHFVAITTWLMKKNQLRDLEQQRTYLRGFQPALLTAVMQRLQLKNPDHHPNVPYSIQDVYEAARFILQGAPIAPIVPGVNSGNQGTLNDPTIKTENISAMFSEFTKNIVDAINNGTMNRGRVTQEIRDKLCNFCSMPHFIRECPLVDEYIRAGKCRRNIEGKIVLSTGAWIPRDIPGNNFKERIDEWHNRNPNQLAAATLLNTIVKPTTAPVPIKTIMIGKQVTTSYQLSATDRIAALEAELFTLKARKPAFVPAPRTRAQKARAVAIADEKEEEEVAAARKVPRIVEITEDEDETPAPTARSNAIIPVPPAAIISTSQPTVPKEPEHPYRNAKDAAYIPPTTKNVGSVEKQAPKKTEPAYKTLPPIYDATVAAKVYKRSMETPITLTQEELLSLSPEIRSLVRDITTTRRMQNKDTVTNHGMVQVEETDEEDQTPAMPTFAVQHAHHRTPPDGSIVIPDPIATYYDSLNGEEPDPDKLTVATDTISVRSIFALVEANRKVECILDSGCQVVAMSEETCHSLGLAYDPSIKLNMQSANGDIDQSLGLARNASFQIGSITVYLQVHVIRSPAYDILLGRPFDILTESIVRNFANEDQTITIRDPNTGNKITVPTLARSRSPPQLRINNGQDF